MAEQCFDAFNVMCLYRCYLVPHDRGGDFGWSPRLEDGTNFPLGWLGADRLDDWFRDPVDALVAMGKYLDREGA